MAAPNSNSIPVRGEAFQLPPVSLSDAATPGSFKANPTLAAGDFKISKDDGTYANLATLPTCVPAAGVSLRIVLNAEEMSADRISISCIDQTATKEWSDLVISIKTVDAPDLNAAAKAGLQRLAFDYGAIFASISDKLAAILAGHPPLVGGRVDASVGDYQNGMAPVRPFTADRRLLVDSDGSVGAIPASLTALAAAVAVVSAYVDDIGVAGAGLSAIPWNAAWDAEVQSEVDDALNTAMTDSIPADGSIGSIRQMVYMIGQFLWDRNVASTTMTIKKVDGSTTLFTVTLNDATSPTALTRAT